MLRHQRGSNPSLSALIVPPARLEQRVSDRVYRRRRRRRNTSRPQRMSPPPHLESDGHIHLLRSLRHLVLSTTTLLLCHHRHLLSELMRLDSSSLPRWVQPLTETSSTKFTTRNHRQITSDQSMPVAYQLCQAKWLNRVPQSQTVSIDLQSAIDESQSRRLEPLP